MKKFLVGLMVLAVAGIAHAYYWNVIWCIGDALSPEDIDGDNSPALLDDYSVTWSLIYGNDVVMDETSGALSSYSLIATASGGPSTGKVVTWDEVDTASGNQGSYNEKLMATGPTTYWGSAPAKDTYSVYHYIQLTGATENASGNYAWLSPAFSVTTIDEVVPQGETRPNPTDLGSMLEPGPVGGTSEYQTGTWVKVTATEVPEPATMSLLGLGALAMALRRKIRK